MVQEIVGTGFCDDCDKRVDVVYGQCDCEPDCKMVSWVCAECGAGMCIE